jgi:ABC-type transport system involved in multi-copper enzyme maturation permease subunit
MELLTGGGLFLAVGVALWYFSGLSLSQQMILWGLLVAAAVVLSRHGWLRLFGPVLFYDLIRITRRSRYFWLRFVYAGALALVVYWQYSEWFGSRARSPAPFASKDMAVFAEQFFNKFMVLQFLLVCVLTPVYAGSAIAEEKDRRTLEFLLATDLGNREIVLSKLVSRLANLTLTVLTGLPILSLIQFMGGVDPDLVLAGFAATAATMVSLASLSILCSVYTRRPRDAILLTYSCLIAYIGAGYLAQLVLGRTGPAPVPARVPSPATGSLTVQDVMGWFNAGNLPLVLSKLGAVWGSTTTPLAAILPGLLRGYLLCHGLIAVVCAGWAIARLRVVALRQGTGDRRRVVVGARRRIRPRVGLQPMVWKEVFVEPGFRLTGGGWVTVLSIVLISLLPGLWIVASYLANTTPPWPREEYFIRWGGGIAAINYWAHSSLGRELNPWVRVTGTIIACLMLLGVAARASTSISGERDRDTMDALLTSPLQSRDILLSKWLGSLLSVRWAWLWLGLIWTAGLLTGGLHPLAVILIAVAWLVYASCFAAIGLWFSTACRTTLRSTLCTLVTSVGVGIGHWALWMCCWPAGSLSAPSDVFWIQGALTPPAVLYWLSAANRELGTTLEWDIRTLVAYFGLLVWAFASLFLWSITRARFRRLTSRMPYHRPEARSYSPVRGPRELKLADSAEALV